ncbi:MAG: tripartite tricarboxylate transporter TctB family protein [bacterium]|nr:tripartite tricarboxylate transporter TctB family protein [bacterium]
MNKDKVGALFFLVLSIGYGVLAFDIPLTFVGIDEVFTARTLPFALAVAGTVIAFLLLVLPSAHSDSDDSKNISSVFSGLNWKQVGLLALLMVFYGLTIRWIGFVLSTILFLIGGFRVLGERRIQVLLLASVPVVIVFWLLMTKVLGVYLDPGSLYFSLGDLL